MNKNSVLCSVMGIISYIIGISYCFTLILLPVAIYCFIGGRMYMELAKKTDGEVAIKKQSLTYWAIFFSIVGFPIGLISIIIPLRANNNVKVSNVEEPKVTVQTTEEVKPEENKVYEQKSDLTDLETIEKLQKFKEDGLITEEEFERAKKEILEKK